MPTTNESVDYAVRIIARQRNVSGRVSSLQAQATTLPYLKELLKLSYDPFIRFGINVTGSVEHEILLGVDLSNSAPLQIDDGEVLDLFNWLRTSTAASATKIENVKRLVARMDHAGAHTVIGILKKNLIQGVAVSTVNKAFPGLITVFSVQLANKFTDRKIKAFPAFVEPKYDGMRAAGIVHPTGEVEVVTRTGREITAAKLFHAELSQLGNNYKAICEANGLPYNGVVFDGEVLGETFNDTVSVFRAGKTATSGTYQIFDMVPMQAITDDSFVSAPYTERRVLLKNVMEHGPGLANIRMSPAYTVNSKHEIWNLYNRARETGMEGIIVKTADGRWQRKRSNDWMKVKAEETLDLKIIGAFEGEGEFTGLLGGLIVDYKGTEVRVGSGFKVHEREILWRDFLDDVVTADNGGGDFKVLGSTVEVQYQEITPAGSLRHPVFVRLRKDKDEVSF